MTAPLPAEKIEAARALWLAGHPQNYVTRTVGIAPETLRRNGIVWSVKLHSDEDKERMRVLYMEKGMSAGEVAKEMGLTRNQVVGLVARAGWKRSRILREVNSAMKRHKSDAPKVNPKPAPKPKVAPVVVVPMKVEPRPFIDRGTGCPWIVSADDAPVPMACCGPVVRGAYCREHGAAAYLPVAPKHKDLARYLRRYL